MYNSARTDGTAEKSILVALVTKQSAIEKASLGDLTQSAKYIFFFSTYVYDFALRFLVVVQTIEDEVDYLVGDVIVTSHLPKICPMCKRKATSYTLFIFG